MHVTPDELKELRKEIDARQQDLADIVGVSLRTIQNWEQPESSREHRAIPPEYENRIQAIADLAQDHKGAKAYPSDLVWLPLPMRQEEINELKHKAEYLELGLTTLMRRALQEIITLPYSELEDKFGNRN